MQPVSGGQGRLGCAGHEVLQALRLVGLEYRVNNDTNARDGQCSPKPLLLEQQLSCHLTKRRSFVDFPVGRKDVIA